MDEPLFRGVDCLRIPVTDLDAAIGFYRGLGMGLVWRRAAAAGFQLGEGGAELVVQTESPEPETDLLVDSVPDAIARFVNEGGQVVVDPFDIEIGRCAVVQDPFGNRLVLLDQSKGLLTS